uniref:Dynamin-like GTPase OPA1, mitochondrial n=2 Tax=Cacopsylla melanoneura TaxID=428564 RepID=A0A8D8XX81_9HEMI
MQQQLLRGSFGNPIFKHIKHSNTHSSSVFKLAILKCQHHGVQQYRSLSHLSRSPHNKQLFKYQRVPLFSNPIHRGYGMIIAKVLKGVLKVRYLVLGGALGGGVTLNKKYNEWKDSLPGTDWIQNYIPDPEKWQAIRGTMIDFKDKMKDIDIDPRLVEAGNSKFRSVKDWWNAKLDEAIAQAELDQQRAEQNNRPNRESANREAVSQKTTVQALTFPAGGESANAKDRIDKMHQEMMETQLRYQRELEKLEKENKELRKQLMLKSSTMDRRQMKKVKKSLIDMYSEVLDELSDYDQSYQTQDHLPRVVVVGDQSAGKTSVLEMIAQARIFPRGGGEMMTRSPVKVTLSEGPYHVAQFKDSSREFDLTKESDLVELRREVERRMLNSVRKGKTVSNEVISMSVKGPGLQRMVLVDLPGIISTSTQDMAHDTRDLIRQMTQTHMSNPNAIILCIQDGSVDAERSNVTDLVSQMDPQGKRTIFVLTKVDLAEQNHSDPQRIKKILAGKLFPMKALGYFAVVTGRGGKKDESIQDIKEYEESFFKKSKLFSDGVTLSSQVTTRNLSFAVSECFWKMVRETVEQQADAFKATRFNLETEWKNSFPRIRELDRDELFERARGEILDEIVNLSQVSVQHWEEVLLTQLWNKVSNYVFETIYLPAAQSGNTNAFNTQMDIKLRQWADQQLPLQSIEAGWEVLKAEFVNFFEKEKNSKDHDGIFDNLKAAVIEEALKRHTWEHKGSEMLRILQLNTLEDQCVSEKQQWDYAVKFLTSSVKEKLDQTRLDLSQLIGPSLSERWIYWKYSSEEQTKRSYVKSELDKIIQADTNHKPVLSPDELTTIRNNLQRSNIDCDIDYVKDCWDPVYRYHFLIQSLAKALDCKKGFYMYSQMRDSQDCCDVVLFWRIQQMLKVTSNALRQQIMNREARRLDKEIKEVLEDYSQDQEKKMLLLTGRRVTLAEELKRVKQIQEKLEEFIKSLNTEK